VRRRRQALAEQQALALLAQGLALLAPEQQGLALLAPEQQALALLAPEQIPALTFRSVHVVRYSTVDWLRPTADLPQPEQPDTLLHAHVEGLQPSDRGPEQRSASFQLQSR